MCVWLMLFRCVCFFLYLSSVLFTINMDENLLSVAVGDMLFSKEDRVAGNMMRHLVNTLFGDHCISSVFYDIFCDIAENMFLVLVCSFCSQLILIMTKVYLDLGTSSVKPHYSFNSFFF